MKAIIMALCLLTPISSSVAALISIGDMYDFMPSDKNTFEKSVNNNGDNTAFVRVNVVEMIYDANGKSHEQALDSDNQENELVVSPNRMVIAAGEQQISRIVYSGNRDRERYYRLRYMPTERNDSDHGQPAAIQISTSIKVLAGLGSIIIVRPGQEHYSTYVTKNGYQYEVRNDGNSTVVIENMQSCDAAYRECAEPETTYVRPGSSKTLPLTIGNHYRYTLVEGTTKKLVHIE
ncbi:molecular chaperone [Pantoea sp. SOD02]|uniref:fimbrial biogenesis chaperone n=1 Tax=Pantoea sp. SOD02 TaxID=2970818 RepID=UPI002157400D|nr:fimbria/pilus periplasmic chaperone [Pantoea sp. SOD02]UVC32092.1 fimbria/pilus periplasmic chaperone [Pantoea sp. SOD02]